MLTVTRTLDVGIHSLGNPLRIQNPFSSPRAKSDINQISKVLCNRPEVDNQSTDRVALIKSLEVKNNGFIIICTE